MCWRSSPRSARALVAAGGCGQRAAGQAAGVSARTVARRLSSVSGLYGFLVVRGDVAASPVPRGLPTRRERTRPRQGVPLVRTPRTLPRVLEPAEVDALTAALRTHRDPGDGFRFVRFAADERSETTLAMLAECFEVLGGLPGKVLADRMGCLKGGGVANVVVPTAEYVRFAAHYEPVPVGSRCVLFSAELLAAA
jgi:hypothetical protein